VEGTDKRAVWKLKNVAAFERCLNVPGSVCIGDRGLLTVHLLETTDIRSRSKYWRGVESEMYVDRPRVLLVDDEKEVADAYALRLKAVADVTVTYGGAEALSTVDVSEPPDVILLDRHMPDQSGDDVLTELRDYDMKTRIVMVTAIDPGLGILDLPFDDYLCKPVEREDIRAAVDQQCQVLAYELLGEYFEVESKCSVIAAELPPERLTDHEEFSTLDDRAAALQDRVCRLLPDADDLLSMFSGIERETY